MSDLDQIRRTLQTHTPAGKDKRHDGCSCFAEALESLARVETVIEAARQSSAVHHGEFKDKWAPTCKMCVALSNLSPSTPVKEGE